MTRGHGDTAKDSHRVAASPRRRVSIRTEHFVVVGGITLLFAGVLIFGQRPRGLGRDPENVRQGSSRFTTPAGGKAYFALLKSVGLPAIRHERMIELLPGDARLLMILATTERFEPSEIRSAQEWVERGGTILWCPRLGTSDDPLLPAFGFELHRKPAADPVEARATLEGGESYALAITRRFRLTSASARPIAQDAEGWIVAEARRGKGRFIAVAEPALISNGGLAQSENAEFMVHLAATAARGGTIAFDEYHHGFTGGQSATAILWDSPLAWSACLILAAMVCGVFATGRRLGPPIDLHEERRRRPAEYIDAFANLCRRMKAGPQALGMVLAEFRLFLQRQSGAAGAGLPLKELMNRMGRLAAAPRVDDSTLVRCTRDLENLRRTIRREP